MTTVVDHLLKSEEPSIRFKVRAGVLGEDPGSRSMREIGRIDDPRCADALDLLAAKRLPDGGWPAERRYYKAPRKAIELGADQVDWGGTSKRRMNEWVTADALAVLAAAGRIVPVGVGAGDAGH